MNPELEALDAVATAQRVRSGEVSAVDVVQAALSRLHTRNPAINAVIDVWADEALAQARAGVPQGLLAGVPMLLKDTIDYPGRQYAMGSRLRLGTPGRHLDPWVAAMRAEGAIFIGKTNTPEFGLMDVTEPLAFGPTRNPWRHSLASGGSSGGSAAAVAARVVALAHGSDGGGSIRYPAACCGVFGLKPTRGRTTMPAPAFDARLATHVSTHVLSLTVRDSALALAVADCAMRGPVGGAAQRWVQAPLTRRLRIAQITQPLHGGPLDATAEAAVLQAAALLRSLGHEVQPCAWPIDAPAVHAAFFDRWAHSVFAEVNGWPEAERVRFDQQAEPWSRALRQEGAAMAPERVEAMVLQCLQASVQMERFHRQWDVLMTPVAAVHALAVGQHAPDLDYETLRQRVQHNVAFTPVQNISGQPAMSVPMGWCQAGLPLGVHFAAGAYQDELLLQLAYQLEAAQPWAHRRPTTLEEPTP